MFLFKILLKSQHSTFKGTQSNITHNLIDTEYQISSSIEDNDHVDSTVFKENIARNNSARTFPDVAPKVDSITFNNATIRVGSYFKIPFKFEIDTVLVYDFLDSRTEVFQRSYGWQEVNLDKAGNEKAFLIYKTLKSLNLKSSWNTTQPAYFILFNDTVRSINVFLPSIGPDRGFGATNTVSAFGRPTNFGKNIMILRTDVVPSYGHTESYSGFWKDQSDKFVEILGPWGLINNGELPDTLKANRSFKTIQSYHCLSYIVSLKFNFINSTLSMDSCLNEYKSFDQIKLDLDSVYVNLFENRNTQAKFKRILLNRFSRITAMLFYYPYYTNRNAYHESDLWLFLSIDKNFGWINKKDFYALGIESCD
jgi:hypothetical protein